MLLAQAGQFEPAFDDFHQTIELNPNFAKAYSNRAALYVLAGELEPALADYQRAVELDPNFAVASRGCGRTCHMLGRVDEALEHLTRAIELAPQDAAAMASRGDLLTDMGQYEAAANDYEQALAVNPKYADACRGSAWLLATCPDGEVRNPGVALERAQRAVELERKADATTLDTLAAAQASVGDFQSATQTIRRAIELAPPPSGASTRTGCKCTGNRSRIASSRSLRCSRPASSSKRATACQSRSHEFLLGGSTEARSRRATGPWSLAQIRRGSNGTGVKTTGFVEGDTKATDQHWAASRRLAKTSRFSRRRQVSLEDDKLFERALASLRLAFRTVTNRAISSAADSLLAATQPQRPASNHSRLAAAFELPKSHRRHNRGGIGPHAVFTAEPCLWRRNRRRRKLPHARCGGLTRNRALQ